MNIDNSNDRFLVRLRGTQVVISRRMMMMMGLLKCLELVSFGWNRFNQGSNERYWRRISYAKKIRTLLSLKNKDFYIFDKFYFFFGNSIVILSKYLLNDINSWVCQWLAWTYYFFFTIFFLCLNQFNKVNIIIIMIQMIKICLNNKFTCIMYTVSIHYI